MSHILIVEDDPDLLDLYTFTLARTGREITALYDPVSAIDLIQNPQFNPDLIFLDINMRAGISGLGLMSLIASTTRLKHVPVVVVTANDIYKEYALKAGAREFLVKPIRISDMADIANRFDA